MTDQPRIVRAAHNKDNPYVMIRRGTLQDERLSWEARGLLAYLLSKPDDWRIDPRNLQQNCGKSKVYAILKELQEAGYLKVETPRDDKGRIKSWDYLVFESPLATPDAQPEATPLPEKQEVEQQEVDNQELAAPDLAKQPYTYKRDRQKRELTKKVVDPPREVQPTIDLEFQLMLYAVLEVTGRDYRRVPAVLTFVRGWQADGYRAENIALAYEELKRTDWRWTDPKRGNPAHKASLEDINEAIGQTRSVNVGYEYDRQMELRAVLARVRRTGDVSAIDPGFIPQLEDGERLALAG